MISLKQKAAKDNYSKLADPKIASEKIYVSNCINDPKEYEIAKKNVKEFSISNPPSEFKNAAEFIKHFPSEKIDKLHHVFYNAPPKDREKIWKNFSFPIAKAEDGFIKVVSERNTNSIKRGYKSSLDLHLNSANIPVSEFNLFLENLDQTILSLNRKLPDQKNLPKWFYSEINSYPCFICRIKNFPFKDLKDVIERMEGQFEILLKYKNKIKISEDRSEESRTHYNSKKDLIEIIINNQQNLGHQCLDLIHELGHAIIYIGSFQKDILPTDRGKYKNELDASKIEFAFLEKNDSNLYRANFANVLSNLVRIVFEMEMYKNPNQKPSKLFSESFNRCFINAGQTDNSYYLIEKRLLYQPFKTLPHAVADINLLSNI